MKNNNRNNLISDKIEIKYVIKFLVSSIFGLTVFMVPIPFFNNQPTISYFADFLATTFSTQLRYVASIIVILSTIMSIVSIFISDEKKGYKFIKKYFTTKPVYVITKIIASVFIVLMMLDINFPIINSPETGRSMLDLAIKLLTISLTLSYILPFLTNSGIMEFFGVITKDLITPLFKVPGVASLDLITSWFGSSNAEVIVCREKYRNGYYNKREAAVIMSNFSLVAVSFVYVVTQVVKIPQMFTLVFLTACFATVILAIIMPRIRPLSKIPNTYYDKKREFDISVPKGWGLFSWGLYQGAKRSKSFSIKEILENGTNVIFSFWLDLIPNVIAWGTIGLIFVYYTPIFEWISYPIGVILNTIGMDEAFKAAPAAIVGFIDMFIPSLILANVESIKTKFIMLVLSLVQMIYITEVGAVMLQSNIDLTFRKVLVIFIERTILSFPIIFLIANIFL